MSFMSWVKEKLGIAPGTQVSDAPPDAHEEPAPLKDVDVLPEMPDDSGFFEVAAIAAAKREAAGREADKLSYASCNGRMQRVTQMVRQTDRRKAVRRVEEAEVEEDRRSNQERRHAN